MFEVEVLPVAGAELEEFPIGIDPRPGIPQFPDASPDHRIGMQPVGLQPRLGTPPRSQLFPDGLDHRGIVIAQQGEQGPLSNGRWRR
ncbi:MAG: hypothetical protein EBU81_09075 [Proteobacteria bacterium]|nr:hypothetical protein [Pseudomonadota bacterium]